MTGGVVGVTVAGRTLSVSVVAMMGTVGVGTTLPFESEVVWSGEPELPGLEITLSVGELCGGVCVFGLAVSEGILSRLIDVVESSLRIVEGVSFGLSDAVLGSDGTPPVKLTEPKLILGSLVGKARLEVSPVPPPIVDGSSPLVCDKFDCVLLGGR